MSNPPFYVLGLGNPGDAYTKTRHNAGVIVARSIAESRGCGSFRRERDLAASVCATDTAAFMTPEVYMNQSGRIVAGLTKRDPACAERIVVIHDDIDLPLGTVRLAQGGAGGHNGVASLIAAMGTDQFIRFKIGISPVDDAGRMRKPAKDRVRSFVLAPMPDETFAIIKAAAERADAALAMVEHEGFAKAQSICNARQ